MADSLHAPWRMDYIRSLEQPSSGCFLCEAAAARVADYPARLILWTTPLSTVMLNRFPYTNGHLLVSPKRHLAELGHLLADELADLHAQSVIAMELLKRCVSAQGFNLGINIGRCAGAGVPGHVHQHVVPRWSGDVNFMSVVGETRIVPQALSQLYTQLMACLPDELKQT